MERGIRRHEIFRDEGDYQAFLTILNKAVMNYNVKVHAYCLMTNHIHLLLETSDSVIGMVILNY